MEKKIKFLLEFCFSYRPLDISTHMGRKFYDKRANDLLKSAEKLKDYVNVDSVDVKLNKEYFDKYFTIDNYHHPIILNYLIDNLSDFENFTYDLKPIDKRDNFGFYELKYKGESSSMFKFREAVGKDTRYHFGYQFVQSVLYTPTYRKAKSKLQELGIGLTGGGSVADYIEKGIVDLKPHIKELTDFLKSELDKTNNH